MPTVHREAGFQFRIFFNDHPPPHVHAINVDGFAKITMGRRMAPHLVEARGLKARDIIRAVRIVARVQDSLLREWIAIHGEDDAYR